MKKFGVLNYFLLMLIIGWFGLVITFFTVFEDPSLEKLTVTPKAMTSQILDSLNEEQQFALIKKLSEEANQVAQESSVLSWDHLFTLINFSDDELL